SQMVQILRNQRLTNLKIGVEIEEATTGSAQPRHSASDVELHRLIVGGAPQPTGGQRRIQSSGEQRRRYQRSHGQRPRPRGSAERPLAARTHAPTSQTDCISKRPERNRTTRSQRAARLESWVTRMRVVPRSPWPVNK